VLKRILKSGTCAKCRICCKYDDDDVWDAPGFTEEEYKENKVKTEAAFIQRDDGLYYLKMEKDSEGIYTCPCLGENGCTLGDSRPFRCGLWPMYLINTEHGLGFALSPVCPEVWKLGSEEIFESVRGKLSLINKIGHDCPTLIEDWSPEYRMIAIPDEKGNYHYLPDEEGLDPHLHFRELSDEEVQDLHENVLKKDFPEDELKKLDIIIKLKHKGAYITLAVYDRGVFVGYAFFSTDSSNKGLCILDYFAVMPELRGKGYGTRILSLITSHFSDKTTLMCEVEDPFATDDPETKQFREKRMNFYISNGWHDTGLSVFMYGVDYRIIGSPVGTFKNPEDVLGEYRKIYVDMVGEEELSVNMKINNF
jgi:GNAT superfamily N-acetyltransferase